MNTDRSHIIEVIKHSPKKRLDTFLSLPTAQQQDVLFSLPRILQREILTRISIEARTSIWEGLDPEDITDLIQVFPEQTIPAILKELPSDKQNSVSRLLVFPHDSAGGILSLDYVTIDYKNTIAHAASKIGKHEKRTGRLPTVIIIKDGKPVGQLQNRALVFGRPKDSVKKFMRKIRTIPFSLSVDDVIEQFEEHSTDKLAVVDSQNDLLGIIYSEDVISIVRERDSESLYEFAGVKKIETVFDTTRQKVRFRYKWLILNLGTAFLAAAVVGLFDEIIARHVLLAVYMPIVAGTGGNAATQTLAVVVRGITLNQIQLRTSLRTLRSEVGSGLINGLINGVIVAAIVLMLNQGIRLAIVLSSAMVINLVVAGFFGTLVPLIMHRLGRDPASSATIFITTATDVLGFFAFLGLAMFVLM